MDTRILMGVLVIGVASLAIGWGTIAYFSDTETSTGNTFSAGALDLTVNGYNDPEVGKVVTIEDMKPSQVKYSNPITLRVHDNPGKLYKRIIEIKCDTGVVTEPECVEQGGKWNDEKKKCYWGGNEDNNDIASKTWFDLEIWDPEAKEWRVLIPDGEVTVRDIAGKWIYLGEYEGGSYIKIRQSFHLDKDVTNWAQGDKCTFKEEFMVLQTNAPHPENCYNCQR